MTKLDTRFRILVLAIRKLSDQELSIALEEFERSMVDVSELFLPLLENRLDRTTTRCLQIGYRSLLQRIRIVSRLIYMCID